MNSDPVPSRFAVLMQKIHGPTSLFTYLGRAGRRARGHYPRASRLYAPGVSARRGATGLSSLVTHVIVVREVNGRKVRRRITRAEAEARGMVKSHWRDCPSCRIRGIPDRFVVCQGCWRRVPVDLRDRVYRGQGRRGDPRQLHHARQAVLDWLRDNPVPA